jgi:hypothetical protein
MDFKVILILVVVVVVAACVGGNAIPPFLAEGVSQDGLGLGVHGEARTVV